MLASCWLGQMPTIKFCFLAGPKQPHGLNSRCNSLLSPLSKISLGWHLVSGFFTTRLEGKIWEKFYKYTITLERKTQELLFVEVCSLGHCCRCFDSELLSQHRTIHCWPVCSVAQRIQFLQSWQAVLVDSYINMNSFQLSCLNAKDNISF